MRRRLRVLRCMRGFAAMCLARFRRSLGDVEASYQGPLIEKNQALLNDLKAYRDAKIAKAREIIATRQ